MDSPVIDFHNHLGRWTRHGMVDHLDRLLRIMDAAGVDKACVNCIFHGDARRGNDIVARAVDRHPERFIPVAFVTPHYPEEAILELERCFDQIGAKFLKIYPSYAQRPIDDGAWAPIFDWCDSRGAAVMSHASFSHGNQPKGYRKLSDRYPNVKWVAAHAAGGTDRHWGAVEATRTCPNVYVETATDDSYFGRFERVVEVAGPDRIVYGSDMPLFDARQEIGKVVTADISDEDKRKILGLNAIKLLGLAL